MLPVILDIPALYSIYNKYKECAMALGDTLKNYVIGERILRGLPNSRPNREELEFAQAGVGKNGIR